MQEDSFDLKRYWNLLKNWAWLLILGLVLGASAGFGASLIQTPIYEAITKVMITRGGLADQSLGTAFSSIYSDELSETYLQLLQTDTVLSTASERLGIDLKHVNIESVAVPNTTILEIKVDHENPKLAALIANTMVDVLVEKNSEIQSERYVLMEESLQAQKSQLETQISNLQSQIEQASTKTVGEQEQWLQEQINSLEQESETLPVEIRALGNPSDPELRNSLELKKARLDQVGILLPLYKQSYADLVVYGTQVDAANTPTNSQLALFTSTQAIYQQIYQSVLSNLETVRLASLENTPNVVSIETAVVPDEPARPNKVINTALGGMVGLMLVAGVLVLNEALDNTVKTPEDIEKISGLSTIGQIAEMKNKQPEETGLLVTSFPFSPIAEAFRNLRTNIEFSGVDHPIKSILITSPDPNSGKSTIAANLAVIFTQKGKKVLLLDADLRRPQVHKSLNLTNRMGLTDLLLEDRKLEEVSQPIDDNDLIRVITSGSLPPNPAELLGSVRMEKLLKELGEENDILIIDSPPSIVADVQLLAARVDGVLLVIQAGRTQRDALRRTIEILKRANARIIGVVINRILRNQIDYYSQYEYQYVSHEEAENGQAFGNFLNKSNGKKKLFKKKTQKAD